MLSRSRRTLVAAAVLVCAWSADLRGAEVVEHPFLGITHITRTETSPRDVRMHVVQIDLADKPHHHASPRGLLAPAFETYDLSPKERPVTSESRLLWDIGQAVHHYVDRVYNAGIICPFNGGATDEAPEGSDASRE